MGTHPIFESDFDCLTDEMDRDRSWYCHQCSANVEITEQYSCQRCGSGFIEELPQQPRRQPTTARTTSRQAPGGANLTIFDILQQFLAPPELPNAQTQNRDGSTRQPTIRIHNADPRSNSVRPSLFVSSDGSLHPGGRHEQVFQGGLHGLLSNLISTIPGAMTGGSFSPGDYAWGQNGLDDIITQLLQTVEGGAPPASRDDVQNLKPEPFQQCMRDKNSQCSVCLTDFEIGDEVIRHPHCSHIFHPSCIRNWLELHDSCPICRTPLRGDPGSNAAEPESGSARNNQEIYEPISPTGEVNVINEPELD